MVGHAVVDQIVRLSDEEISTWGFVPGTHTVIREEARWRSLKPLLDTAVVSAGGSVANTAVDLTRLGVPVTLFVKVGEDQEGRLFLNSLRSPLLEVLPSTISLGAVTQKTLILSSSKERTLVANLTRAVAALDTDDLDPSIIQSARIIMLPAFFLNRPNGYALMARIIELAAKTGGEVVLSLSGPRISSDQKPVIRRLLEEGAIKLCLGNEAEVVALTGITDSYMAQAKLSRGGAGIVVTLGSNGARAVVRGRTITVPARQTSPIDPTGAGDAFAAGFLLVRLEGGDLPSCMAGGNDVARQAIRSLGARPSLLLRPPQLAIEQIGSHELS